MSDCTCDPFGDPEEGYDPKCPKHGIKPRPITMIPTITSLTDDQKRVLLAKADNFICVSDDELKGNKRVTPGGPYTRRRLPNYLADLNAAITLCDMLAKKGWKMHFHKGTSETWEVEMYREADSHFVIFGPLATAISHCALLALNLATK